MIPYDVIFGVTDRFLLSTCCPLLKFRTLQKFSYSMECIFWNRKLHMREQEVHILHFLQLTQRHVFQFLIFVAAFLDFHVMNFALQKLDFSPLLAPKRHPSFGWSSFHTSPIWKQSHFCYVHEAHGSVSIRFQ